MEKLNESNFDLCNVKRWTPPSLPLLMNCRDKLPLGLTGGILSIALNWLKHSTQWSSWVPSRRGWRGHHCRARRISWKVCRSGFWTFDAILLGVLRSGADRYKLPDSNRIHLARAQAASWPSPDVLLSKFRSIQCQTFGNEELSR